jgi:hypothetical protein
MQAHDCSLLGVCNVWESYGLVTGAYWSVDIHLGISQGHGSLVLGRSLAMYSE